MTVDLTQKAISAALNGNWDEAKQLNLELLDSDPLDTNALNRLSRAYAELNDLENARKMATKVLEIDPFNPIALKAMEKWKGLKQNIRYGTKPTPASIFLEEPGKTKILQLINLGSTDVLCQLDAGDELTINHHGHLITICLDDGKRVGKFPDVFSRHLKSLINHGNEYRCYVKSASKTEVSVIVRETKRSQELKDIASFSSERREFVTIPDKE